jgi:hypothetical protein
MLESRPQMEIVLGIVGGGLITIATAIFIEWLRKPRLVLSIEPKPLDVINNGVQFRHLRLVLKNKPLVFGFRWMQRSAALQCNGTITFHNQDGQDVFGKAMAVRWASTPPPINASGQIVDLQQPAQLKYRIVSVTGMESIVDVYPGEEEILDVAVRINGEAECYGWNNESYFHGYRTPDWKLGRGVYLVRVIIATSGTKCIATFRLMHEAEPLTAFRLENTSREEEKKIK